MELKMNTFRKVVFTATESKMGGRFTVSSENPAN
jgi:hypothetical protein